MGKEEISMLDVKRLRNSMRIGRFGGGCKYAQNKLNEILMELIKILLKCFETSFWIEGVTLLKDVIFSRIP